MADETPVFQIQRMYLKDLSLEQPNSPGILLEQAQPQVDINLAMAASPVTDGIFEVTVTATVTTKVKDKRPASSRSATCPKSRCRASSASSARR